MKTVTNLLTIAAMISLVSFSQNTFAANGNNGEESATAAPALSMADEQKVNYISNMTSFTVQHVDGSSYVNLRINTESSDCMYVIERSIDGNKFEAIGFKEGYGNPEVAVTLLYSFVDKEAVEGSTLQYRIKRVDFNGEVPVAFTPVQKIAMDAQELPTEVRTIEHPAEF